MTPEQEAKIAEIFAKHRRHIEQSPGAGEDCQKYALATCDDLENDIRAALADPLFRDAIIEECAKVCDSEWNGDSDTLIQSEAYNECAAAIRALKTKR